ncbi:MAG: hypothetical protein ACTHK7_00720 [Aureliella sp.]
MNRPFSALLTGLFFCVVFAVASLELVELAELNEQAGRLSFKAMWFFIASGVCGLGALFSVFFGAVFAAFLIELEHKRQIALAPKPKADRLERDDDRKSTTTTRVHI